MLGGGRGSLEGGLGEGRARREESVIVVKKSMSMSMQLGYPGAGARKLKNSV